MLFYLYVVKFSDKYNNIYREVFLSHTYLNKANLFRYIKSAIDDLPNNRLVRKTLKVNITVENIPRLHSADYIEKHLKEV